MPSSFRQRGSSFEQYNAMGVRHMFSQKEEIRPTFRHEIHVFLNQQDFCQMITENLKQWQFKKSPKVYVHDLSTLNLVQKFTKRVKNYILELFDNCSGKRKTFKLFIKEIITFGIIYQSTKFPDYCAFKFHNFPHFLGYLT